MSKTSNEYAAVIPEAVYQAMPKAVLAAIAVSYASAGGHYLNDAAGKILNEWKVLNENGVVPQKVPAKFSELVASE